MHPTPLFSMRMYSVHSRMQRYHKRGTELVLQKSDISFVRFANKNQTVLILQWHRSGRIFHCLLVVFGECSMTRLVLVFYSHTHSFVLICRVAFLMRSPEISLSCTIFCSYLSIPAGKCSWQLRFGTWQLIFSWLKLDFRCSQQVNSWFKPDIC